ncbi:MAG: hypothetical protein V2I74_10975 [Erythrobacter sp.]|jgi:hypothetical protein|nr:hypothetical protein [Erythrobacter sp.]
MSRRPYLLFSSVGDTYDRAIESWNPDPWAGHSRRFDIALVYYGDDAARFAALAARADRIYWSKGSKFQNLLRHLDAVSALAYRYVWVVDDDIALSPAGIERLFRITEDYGLAASQPAFSLCGQVCHPVTGVGGRWSLLRYTNFVEVTCPVLSRRALERLVAVIRPHMDLLTCWGIDILLTHHVWGPNAPFAVIDAVPVRNPHGREKRGGRRECERMHDIDALRDRWLAVRERLRPNRPPAAVQLAQFGMVRRWPFSI